MKTVAITGANGYIGSYLARRLEGQGWQVRRLVRQADPLEARQFYFDLRRPGALADAALQGADVLIHCAYLAQNRGEDASLLNQQGTEVLLQKAAQAGVRQRLFFSTTSAHPGARSVYGKSKLALERLFNGPGDLVLKCGLVVGPGGLFRDMVRFAKRFRLVPLIDAGRQPLQCIGLSQVGDAVQAALNEDLTGCRLLAQPQQLSYKAFFQAVARHYGARFVFLPLLAGLLRGLFRLLPAGLPVGAENLAGLEALRYWDSAADLQRLGVPEMPFAELLEREV